MVCCWPRPPRKDQSMCGASSSSRTRRGFHGQHKMTWHKSKRTTATLCFVGTRKIAFALVCIRQTISQALPKTAQGTCKGGGASMKLTRSLNSERGEVFGTLHVPGPQPLSEFGAGLGVSGIGLREIEIHA